MTPEICPKCGAKIRQEIVPLKDGGFLYKEICSKNSTHYTHYREPTYQETLAWN